MFEILTGYNTPVKIWKRNMTLRISEAFIHLNCSAYSRNKDI